MKNIPILSEIKKTEDQSKAVKMIKDYKKAISKQKLITYPVKGCPHKTVFLIPGTKDGQRTVDKYQQKNKKYWHSTHL